MKNIPELKYKIERLELTLKYYKPVRTGDPMKDVWELTNLMYELMQINLDILKELVNEET